MFLITIITITLYVIQTMLEMRAHENAFDTWAHNINTHKENTTWKKMKTSEIVRQHITTPEEYNNSSTDNNTKQQVQPEWHDLMAQHLVVSAVWAYNIYMNKRRIMLGITDPAHLNPKNMPRAEQAEQQAQEDMINNIKLATDMVRRAYYLCIEMKWTLKQRYYKYKSDRARDITPGRVHTLTHTTTGGRTTPTTIPTYTYHTSTY